MVFYVDLIFCTTWQLYIIMVTSLQVEHMNLPKSCLLCIRRLFGLPQMINIKEDEVEKRTRWELQGWTSAGLGCIANTS